MSLMAGVQNGQIVESASQSSLSKANATNGSDMDKDAFLQLLVAQMKYQDPLQPTSNTEYIAQYAQFSQVEQMQNMAASMDLQRASGLVGQYVYIKTVGSTGETNYVNGKVDYVVYENNKAYLSVNEQLYSIDDLDTVVDKAYMDASDKAYAFVAEINQLPNINSIDLTDAYDIDALEQIYNAMSDYEKSFVASDVVKDLEEYVSKIQELRLVAQQKAEAAEKAEKTEETEGTGKTEAVESTEETGKADTAE